MTTQSLFLNGAIRDRVNAFVDDFPTTVATRLAGGIHTNAAPDNAVYPYAILTVSGGSTGRLDDSDIAEDGTIELMIVGRGRAQAALIAGVADTAEKALWKWTTDDAGWFSIRSRESRSLLPPMPQPPNAEIVRLRVVWRYTWWPAFRLQQARSAGT